MKSCDSIQGVSTLESLRGSSYDDLTLGITRDAPARASGGLHRFEPVEWNGITSVPGNITYPTRNFATLGPFICVNDLNLEDSVAAHGKLLSCALHVATKIGLYHHHSLVTLGV